MSRTVGMWQAAPWKVESVLRLGLLNLRVLKDKVHSWSYDGLERLHLGRAVRERARRACICVYVCVWGSVCLCVCVWVRVRV